MDEFFKTGGKEVCIPDPAVIRPVRCSRRGPVVDPVRDLKDGGIAERRGAVVEKFQFMPRGDQQVFQTGEFAVEFVCDLAAVVKCDPDGSFFLKFRLLNGGLLVKF